MTTDKKYKVIIDTDPGVDDSVCIIYALFNDKIDIQLFTTVVGNVSVEKSTRNILHLLDIFEKNIPVAQGASKAMKKISETAEFIHQKEGLGGYVPPQTVHHNVIKEDAVSAIYRVLKNGNGDIIPIVLGPQTNFGELFTKHPDVIEKIPTIYFMGGSPFGHPDHPDHISFNISCDPDAFQIVLDSKIPLVMVPSNLGRRKAHLDQAYVNSLKTKGDAGKLIYYMYSKYWEPNFPDKRVSTNDICAMLALTNPELFSMHNSNVNVDIEKDLGKTYLTYEKTGNVKLVSGVNREGFIKLLDDELEKIKDVKLNVVFPND